MVHITINIKTFFIFISFLTFYFVYLVSISSTDNKHKIVVSDKKVKDHKFRNWYDYKLVEKDNQRIGVGELGARVFLSDPNEISLNEKLYQETGFAVVISDKISVNRSLPQVVHLNCTKFKYFSHLPNVSIVIIFHNEVKSVLLRTVHSVVNRTPSALLHEIILVNDNSSSLELYEPLVSYVAENFRTTNVKIKNMKKRSGLIVARMVGARMATGEVLVFFDSHVEVQFNWLPPLLQPIVNNRRIATLPIIDYFSAEDFSYLEGQESFQGERFDTLNFI